MYLSKYKLGDIANVTISGVDKKIKEGETTVKLCNFVDVYHNWSITKDNYGTFLVASVTDKERNALSLKKGQVAITKDSETRYDIGISTFIGETFDDVVLGYHCALISIDEDIVLGSYLNAFLHSSFCQKYFELNATGSGMRYTLSVETINNLPIYAPPISEQKKIVYLLEALDRKIALNRKINAELEQMAKELYDYWFVQFDFPNAEGKPYKSSGGKMVYNPQLKRDIPEGWEVKSVVDCTDVLYGYPFSTEMFVEEHIGNPVIRIRDIQDGTSSAFTTEEVDEKYRVEDGDVVLGMDGNFHCSIWHNNESFLNQRCVRFRVLENTHYTPFSIYFSLQPYIEQKQRTIIGSTVGHLLDSDIREMYLLTPNVEWQTIKSAFLSLSNKIIKNKRETTELVVLRDQLLPLLMNGQVKIN